MATAKDDERQAHGDVTTTKPEPDHKARPTVGARLGMSALINDVRGDE